jgi:F420-dependent oxidoreductase-like protein
MRPLSIGIKTVCQHTTHDALLRVWREADQIESIDHAWMFDHLNPIAGEASGPCFEGWSMMAAYAAYTSRIRIGLMVTGMTYRHPAVLAHIAATVDVISNGRLDLGIGAGWNVYEHESNGIPLYEVPERLRRFREACELMKLLFTQPVANYDGQYFQLKEARLEPKPVQKPYPPFVIGGSGEKVTMKIAAQHADAWNMAGGDVETFRHKVRVLHDHCETVGRNPDEIDLSVQQVVDYGDLAGTTAAAQAFVDAGANHIILNLRPPFPDGICTRLAEEVIPRVRGR